MWKKCKRNTVKAKNTQRHGINSFYALCLSVPSNPLPIPSETNKK